MTLKHDLTVAAAAICLLPAAVIASDDLGVHAVEYAEHGWPVFPLRGKVPAIPGGHGVLDATTDIITVIRWWSGAYAGCNIGGRVPEGMIVLDIDPRHDGDESLAALENTHGKIPPTLTTLSGRGDGGAHMFLRRPPGKLSARRLGTGIDLKTSSGYVVLAPSIHPDSGQPYERLDGPVADTPRWLADLLTDSAQPNLSDASDKFTGPSDRTFTGPSVAAQFDATATWSQLLAPHGWTTVDGDGDDDGARWRHPHATAPWSATVQHGCLFVFSPNTPFDQTESGHPKGYTKFHAYAVLEHGGDRKAAYRSLVQRGSTR